jgi:hypothetical protein
MRPLSFAVLIGLNPNFAAPNKKDQNIKIKKKTVIVFSASNLPLMHPNQLYFS